MDQSESRAYDEGLFLPVHNVGVHLFSRLKVEVELRIINSVEDIPTKIAVHGTTRKAWESIRMFYLYLGNPTSTDLPHQARKA